MNIKTRSILISFLAGLLITAIFIGYRRSQSPPSEDPRREEALQKSQETAPEPSSGVPLRKKTPRQKDELDKQKAKVEGGPFARIAKLAKKGVLGFRETSPDKRRKFERKKIVRMEDFKYPLVLVVETYEIDPKTGKSKLVKTVKMVADHLVLKVKDGITQEQIDKLVSKYNAKIRGYKELSQTYIISFEGSDIEALENKIEGFKSERNVVQSAEPDYLVGIK